MTQRIHGPTPAETQQPLPGQEPLLRWTSKSRGALPLRLCSSHGQLSAMPCSP